eukprot:4224195-Alexandrium_andersonii.AAC.1
MGEQRSRAVRGPPLAAERLCPWHPPAVGRPSGTPDLRAVRGNRVSSASAGSPSGPARSRSPDARLPNTP